MSIQQLTYGMFVDGRFVDASGEGEVTVVNPATEGGVGRELSDHGLHEYVELKTVYWPVG